MSPRALLVLFWVHLVVPILLFLDTGLHLYMGGWAGPLVFGTCSLWLIGALWGLARHRERFLQKIAGPMLGFLGVCFVVLLLEVGLRLFSSLGEGPQAYMYQPGLRIDLQTDPRIMPGIEGPTRFTVNDVGLRGPAFPRDSKTYKIITVGGSTTECLYLDDSEEWPHLLMEELNRRQKRPVWVANAGRSGHTAVHHLMLLRTLPVVRQADLLILLIGANDLVAGLAYEGGSSQALLQERAETFRQFITRPPEPRYPLFKRMKVYQLVKRAARYFESSPETRAVIDYDAARKKRMTSPVVPLPNLQVALEEYRGRILRLNGECRSLGKRCLFLTQPSMWRKDLSPAEQALLWFGYVGPSRNVKGYLSVADAAVALDAYNRVLLQVCREQSMECLDLEPQVPKDTSAFYDDFHFNEGGARIVARVLADYLMSRRDDFSAGPQPSAMQDTGRVRRTVGLVAGSAGTWLRTSNQEQRRMQWRKP